MVFRSIEITIDQFGACTMLIAGPPSVRPITPRFHYHHLVLLSNTMRAHFEYESIFILIHVDVIKIDEMRTQSPRIQWH